MKTNNFSLNGNARNEQGKNEATVANGISKLTRVAILVVVMTIAAVVPATAQVRLGIRGGITSSELKDVHSLLDSKKRTAYTGGLVLDMNIPKVNLGLEVSALYRHRENRVEGEKANDRYYFDIPIYLRYRLAIPGVEKAIAPIVFTGPNVSLLFMDKTDPEYEASKTKLSWDVGAGVDLVKHLRLTVSYGIGMTKAMKVIGKTYEGQPIEGKDNCWTVSAAIMF